MEAVYANIGYSSFDELYIDEKIKTYRLGVQFPLEKSPMFGPLAYSPNLSLQLEAGLVEYEGTNYAWWHEKEDYRSTNGVSIAAAWVNNFSDNMAFMIGGEMNYLDRNKTHLPYNVSFMLNTGVVFQF
ncbi:hypothetical protein [Vibrio mexicanus]|uniref:hypothetical protein n=1 Tax=Vibrio mexicanus TaxID=1004326 RepID=UPI00069AC6D2|nr:hypothetical protein [Vibrio mexicanus]